MDQIFSPIANTLARFSLLGVLVLVIGLFWFFEMMQRSTYYSQRAVVHQHENDKIVVFGSFLTVAETMAWLKHTKTSTL